MLRQLLFTAASLVGLCATQLSEFQPCPLLGPYQPIPRIDPSAPAVKAAFEDFTATLDQYIADADGRYGPITPNTTSFSMSLFAGSNHVMAEGDQKPYLYEYHHAASAIDLPAMDADTVFAIGDLTQMFTALAVILELGDKAWSESIVDYIPELNSIRGAGSPIDQVQWEDVTLGALASHLGGIARDSNACQINEECPITNFLEKLHAKPPVELPDSTNVFSHAAFQLLAFALERECGKPFSQILQSRIIEPLGLNNTGLLTVGQDLFGTGLLNTSLEGEPASLGLTASIADLSVLGHALLANDLLTATELRRWLKPVSSTSNLRNSVGRPFEIYHYGNESTDPIIDVYTKSGTVGRYSSYFGLVPSVGVGFSILAVNGQQQNPDLNAYADIMLDALTSFLELAYAEANATIVGNYEAPDEGVLSLRLTGADPGIDVTALSAGNQDWLAVIAAEAGVDRKEYLSLRLYATGLEQQLDSGRRRQVFQGAIQDKSALADAGTPTCITWQSVGKSTLEGVAVDRFIITFDEDGVASAVEWPAGNVTFAR